jgi:hypothetical protein
VSATELALARELAAADLEFAIAAVRGPLERLLRLTAQVEAEVRVELRRPVDTLIGLHLTQAQLGAWLEQKLTSIPASLQAYVEEQHARVGIKPTSIEHRRPR